MPLCVMGYSKHQKHNIEPNMGSDRKKSKAIFFKYFLTTESFVQTQPYR